jgi:hypothetical protein
MEKQSTASLVCVGIASIGECDTAVEMGLISSEGCWDQEQSCGAMTNLGRTCAMIGAALAEEALPTRIQLSVVVPVIFFAGILIRPLLYYRIAIAGATCPCIVNSNRILW